MNDYQKYKNKVVDLFNQCISFAEENGYNENVECMKFSKKKVEENRLMIMTCGEMRMGKSSMLTAFLEDKDLFPVDVDVTTCMITMVSYAEKEKITVVLEENGEENSIEISRAQIADYAKEQNNRHNKKHAKLILIETPNKKLKNGLVFVDTPGVGSLNIEHSQITYEFLPRADLVLFVSDASKPYTEPELGFMERIKKSCNNILFVMTKVDIQQDYESIIEKNRAMIQSNIGISPDKQIYVPISSKLQMMYLKTEDEDYLEESNFKKLQDTLWELISKNRAGIIIYPRLVELKNDLGVIGADIKIRETAFSGDNEKILVLSNRLKELSEKRQFLLNENANWQLDVSSKVSKLGASFITQVSSFQQSINETINECLKDKKYINQPYQLVDEVVCLVSQQSQRMREMLHEGVEQIKKDFEEDSGLNIDMNDYYGEFSVDENSGIVFEKVKKIDKMMNMGGKISSTSFRMTAFGTAAGALVGGILGFFAGGPAGMITGGKAGMAVSATLSTACGMTKGGLDALKEIHDYDPNSIRQELQRYIQRTITRWNDSRQQIMSDLNVNCTKSLRATINESKARIDADIVTVQKSRQMNAEEQKKEWERLQIVKRKYALLVSNLGSIAEVSKNVREQMTKNEENTNNDVYVNNTSYIEPDLDD